MSTPSKLVLADRLAIDLTLLVSKRISERAVGVEQASTRREKVDRCGGINVFGDRLTALYQFQETIKSLRKSGKLGLSAELNDALDRLCKDVGWLWAREEINIKERLKEIRA